MNRDKLKRIENAIRTVNPDMIIIGDIMKNEDGKYYIEFVPDSHKFPNFISDSEEETMSSFYDYINNHKMLSDRIRRLRMSGCTLPIMIVSMETGKIYNGDKLNG